MVRYLKKRAMFHFANELSDVELPPCKEFVYTFFEGVEWLKCNRFHICCQRYGAWISIQHEIYDDSEGGYHIEEDIFSYPVNGKYTYHNHNGKQIVIDEIKKNTEGQNYVQSNSNCKSEGWSEQDYHNIKSRGRTR